MFTQLSNFLTDKFNYYLSLTVGGLILMLVLLAVIGAGTKPHVRSILVNGSNSSVDSVLAPKFRIDFSRPMNHQSVEAALQIDPEVEFDTSWSSNTLLIKFKYNFGASTSYTLQIGEGAKDIYGTHLAENYKYSFITPADSFVYLERNSREYRADKVISYLPSTGESKVLYQAENIQKFTQNGNYLVVAVDTGNGSAIRIIDLAQNSFHTLDFGGITLQVNKMVMSPVSDQIAFTAQEVELVNGIAVPKTGDYIYVYDIVSHELTQLPPNNVLDIQFAPDGSSVLFRGDDALYYLIEIVHPENYVELGRHFATGGFNRSREQIVFVDYDPINLGSPYPFLNVYDKNRQSITLTAGENFVVDPEFFHNSNKLAISEKYQDLEGTRGLFGIVIVNEDGTKQPIITLPGFSLELPKVSLDDRYLLIEKYNAEQLVDYQDMRDFVFQTKPYQGTLVIYDLNQQKFLDVELHGVDGEWR